MLHAAQCLECVGILTIREVSFTTSYPFQVLKPPKLQSFLQGEDGEGEEGKGDAFMRESDVCFSLLTRSCMFGITGEDRVRR